MKDKKPHLTLVEKKPAQNEAAFAISIGFDLEPVFENDEVVLYRFQSEVAGQKSLPSYQIMAKVKLLDNK